MRRTLLLISGIVAGWAGMAQTTIFSENFDGSAIPTGWTTTDETSSGFTWQVGMPQGSSLNGTNCVYLDSDADGDGPHLRGTLTSPTIDASASMDLTLEMIHYYNDFSSADDSAFIEIYDGTQWIVDTVFVGQDAGTGYSAGSHDSLSIDISAYANANLQLRFTYDDGDDWTWQWAIDDVKLVSNSFVSIDKNEDLTVSLYPNPATDNFVVSSETPVKEVRIYNLIGEQVQYLINTKVVPVSDLPAGTYLVKVKTESGELTQKLIKE